MRLVTRADFDGLCCAALLKEIGLVDEIKYVHPKDVQDGLVEVSANDILANIPFVQGAGMWFDHHMSEAVRLKEIGASLKGLKGAVKKAPSAARVVWDYYGGFRRFPNRFEPMMTAVDKVDSADLNEEEILHPEGWVLLGFLMDPRTGLGRHPFARNNWEVLADLVDHCRTLPIEEILALPDISERIIHYFEQEERFKAMLATKSTVRDKVVVTDLRDVDEFFVGNRFMIYAMYPGCSVGMQLMWDHKKENIVFTVGHSIVNRTCKANIGTLLLEHGGGGHFGVGTCQVAPSMMEHAMESILARLAHAC
ncbi:MAG: exopolyphosphatase [Desulfovibrionaceae bacterium]